MLQSRDRRPRLETPPSLSQGEECLTDGRMDISSLIYIVLQSRDRRPHLGTPPSLPQGEECLTEDCMNRSSLIYIELQSRDRRPRLSACKSLNNILLGYIPSFGGAWGGFYWLYFRGQTRASVPTCGYCLPLYQPIISTKQITSLLVNLSTRQLYLIIILNCEL